MNWLNWLLLPRRRELLAMIFGVVLFLVAFWLMIYFIRGLLHG